MTLTGTYYDDNGENPIEINQTVNFTVDWYGNVKTTLTSTSQNYDISKIVQNEETNEMSLQFNVATKESAYTNQGLILKENVVTAEIPEIEGIKATNVTVAGSNINYEYNEETRILEIKRELTIAEDGTIVKELSRTNSYTIIVTYPKQAYEKIDQELFMIDVPVTGYYVGYNNINREFENPIKSNVASGNLGITYRKEEVVEGISKHYFSTTIGEYVSGRGYVVSKKKARQLYNNEIDEIGNDKYIVKWGMFTGNENIIESAIMKEQTNNYTDKFQNTQNVFYDMVDYTNNIGIYFSGVDSSLEEDGYIKIYNDETDKLLYTFTKDEWLKYNKSTPFMYEESIKHVRIETSKLKQNTNFFVYNVKEIDNNLLLEKFSKEEFDEIIKVNTYFEGSLKIEGSEELITVNKTAIANYEDEISNMSISTTPKEIGIQQTSENHKITINTTKTNYNEAYWKDGEFIVELPEEIIAVNVNDITVNNSNVEIMGYEVIKENGKYLIKILTLNEEQTTYSITIDCNLTPDVASTKINGDINLYAYNKQANNYYISTKDIYDLNKNENKEELVGLRTTSLSLKAPNSIVTSQYLSNYDENNSVEIAPNIVDLDTKQKNATVNMAVVNKYALSVSDVKILGVIPFEGNKYITNEKELMSEFSTQMADTGIIVPEELQDKVIVYYSTNPEATKDLEDENNGWTTSPESFSNVKRYLIDFGDYEFPSGKSYTFKYNIIIPDDVQLNKTSYCEHLVYLLLNTEEGNLQTQIEPSKLGIRVIRRYNAEITKQKAGTVKVVPGATYKIAEKTENGEENSKLVTTNSEGKLLVNGLFVGKKYILKEVKPAENYTLNNDEIEFEVVENEDGTLKINVLSEDNFLETPIIEGETLKAIVEDEPKYKLVITKTDEKTGDALANVRFKLEEKNKTYITNSEGQIEIGDLDKNTIYTISETYAQGYYLADDIQFKLITNENNVLKLESLNESFANAVIQNNEQEDIITVNVNITNEKIPTYNLQIIKVEENLNEENIEKLKPLEGARFRITTDDISVDSTFPREYTTDENGYINIPELYQYVEGKNVTGKYTLQEIKAPDGYSNNAEKIQFIVSKNTEGNLEINIDNKDNLTTVKNVIIEENTVKLIIQDKPLFKLTKTDSETGEPLANAEFIIYELNENSSIKDYAKDVNGDYVGEQNEDGDYVFITDKNGVITIPLRPGMYMAVEVGFPEGYLEKNEKEVFKVGGKEVEDGNIENQEDIGKEILKINYIEDLVELSNSVNSGNTYSNTVVKLMRTLDFEDDNSYRGDKNSQKLKQQLTNKDGSGFTPIGLSYDSCFSGIFDGQENEIQNLYINNSSYEYAGLFGYVKGAEIKNLGVTGEVSGPGYVGGIVGCAYMYSSIDNCYNIGEINGPNAGGIVGYLNYISTISNSYNTGKISSNGYAGGIVGIETTNGMINNSYNTGEINGIYVGGIIGYAQSAIINGSYNTGKVSGMCAGGIVGGLSAGDISNSYNIGQVSSNGDKGMAGAIVAARAQATINNCYYPDTLEIIGQTINSEGTELSEAYMKSEIFLKDFSIEYLMDTENINNGYPIFGKEIEKTEDINYIEDLVDLSIKVNSGNNYSNTTIKLLRTINFEDDSSYKDPTDISYGDLNGDGKVESIKEELTNRDGTGFTPIGSPQVNEGITKANCFSGTFDGQGNEIQNLYININGYAGLFGYGISCEIKNLGITGEINGDYVGGIVGILANGNISNSYNTGKITASYYAGGLAGNTSQTNISNSYNTGKISSPNGYAGGIVGADTGESVGKSISNNYNIGEINGTYAGGIVGSVGSKVSVSKNYNTGDISANYYAGGIVGYLFKGSVSNSYNTGNANAGNTAGGIVGYLFEGSVSNCYYLNSIEITGTNQNLSGTSVSDEYLKSQELFGLLNIDGAWIHINNKYPKLIIESYKELTDSTEINIENTIKKLKITTDINEINGVKGGSISGEDEEPYETIIYGENSTKEIVITPENGYGISNITINGQTIDYLVNENGSYKIPVGYFTNIKEDKAIVVTFSAQDQILIINKVAEQDETKKLQGTKFKVEQIDTRPDITNEIGDLTANGEYSFTENNGKYISNNQGQNNTTANSYIPIDLTNTTGKYNLKINAEISSASGDYGYATITNTTTPPKYYSSTGRLIYLTGVQGAKDYTTVLEAGKMYYLHLGYYKNGSTSSGEDTLTINSVELSLNKDDYYTGEFETNAYGQIRQGVPVGKYKITELQATEGYTLNSEPIIYDVETGKNNEITITNKSKQKVIVHHYLKNGDEYTKIKIAEDEEIKGDIGTQYITSPKVNLENLELEKNEQGDYILPENATGNYIDGTIEVTYYYQTTPITLTINHYLDGSNMMLADSETITFEPQINIVDNKLESINIQGQYNVKQNTTYNKLLEECALTYITNNDNIVEEENIIFNNNTQLNYYYSYYDDNVQYKVEYYYDGILNEDETIIVEDKEFGDVIAEYENKIITGYVLEKEENFPLILTNVREDNVIRIYYVKGNFEYKVEYYYDGILDESKTDKFMAEYKTEITQYEDKALPGYVLDRTSTLPLVISEYPVANVIKVYYKFGYTVNYYYEGVLDKTKTEHIAASVGDIIETYPDKTIYGYEFAKTENLPLTIAKEDNVINVYYTRKDSQIKIEYRDKQSNKEISGKVIKNGKVLDNYDLTDYVKMVEGYTLVESPEITGTFEEETKTLIFYYAKNTSVKAMYLEQDDTPDVITDNKVLAKEETILGYVGKDYKTEKKDIENYKFVESTLNTEGKMTEGAITVIYYYKPSAKVTVNYIDKNTGDVIDTTTEKVVIGDTYTSISKDIEDYVLVERPESETIVMTNEDIILNYYYVHISEGVVEKHIVLNTDKVLYNEIHTGNEGDQYKIEPKEFEGYDLIEEKLPTNAEGTMTIEQITVIYYYRREIELEVNYIDIETNKEIIEKDGSSSTVIITGYEGEEYNTEEKIFEDYEIVKEKYPENCKGTFKVTVDEDGNEITQIKVQYYYKHISKVIENHIDITTNKVLNSIDYKGNKGDEYSTKQSSIEGYDIVVEKLPSNAQGIMTYEPIVVNYYYIKKVQVVVEYLDKMTGAKLTQINEETNAEIDSTEYINGHEGDQYKTIEKTFNNYILKETTKNTQGIMTAIRNEDGIIQDTIYVKYYYAHKSAGVIEHHIDIETGEELQDQVEYTGYEGDAYETSEKQFDGYELIQHMYPENAKGTMTRELIEVNYYYSKKMAPTDTNNTDSNTKNKDNSDGGIVKTGDNIILIAFLIVLNITSISATIVGKAKFAFVRIRKRLRK